MYNNGDISQIIERILFSDQKALSKPHQAADERLHGLLPHREEEDRRAKPWHSQRWDLQAARQKVGIFSIIFMIFMRYMASDEKDIVEVFP